MARGRWGLGTPFLRRLIWERTKPNPFLANNLGDRLLLT
jgi:hypothetical protein